MSKLKNKKRPQPNVKRGTLDQKHTEKLQQLKKRGESLPFKRQKLRRLEAELRNLQRMSACNYTDTDIKRKSELMDSIEYLKRDIKSIEDGSGHLNYITKALPILIDYYNGDFTTEEQIENDFINEIPTTGRKNILSYFYNEDFRQLEKKGSNNDKTNTESDTDNSDESEMESETKQKNKKLSKRSKTKKTKSTLQTRKPSKSGSKTSIRAKLESKPKTKPKVSRTVLYENYLNATDINYRRQHVKTNLCNDKDCNGEKILSHNDSSMVCQKCGLSEPILLTNDKPNYKEPVQDSGTYAYKRSNHLTEILSQLQAKESTDIPSSVFDAIYRELQKCKIDKNDLDIFRLRRILKKQDLRNYYDHVPHILQTINGKEPPNFSRQTEAKIRKMFADIQKPFELFRPKTRKNFLNYSYVLHKFCELLGLDEYVGYFPLLKNNSKLLQHDKIWMQICEYMKWEFIKSI